MKLCLYAAESFPGKGTQIIFNPLCVFIRIYSSIETVHIYLLKQR